MSAHSQDDHRCRVCGRTFDAPETLERHLRDQGVLW